MLQSKPTYPHRGETEGWGRKGSHPGASRVCDRQPETRSPALVGSAPAFGAERHISNPSVGSAVTTDIHHGVPNSSRKLETSYMWRGAMGY